MRVPLKAPEGSAVRLAGVPAAAARSSALPRIQAPPGARPTGARRSGGVCLTKASASCKHEASGASPANVSGLGRSTEWR